MRGTLSSPEIDHLLKSEVLARLACHFEGRTYVVPTTYAYVDGVVYGHSMEGLKLDMLRKNPKVCLEVDRVDDLANWRSVIAWGDFEELVDSAAERALDLLASRFIALTLSSAGAMPSRLRSTSVHARSLGEKISTAYRITLTEVTGRFETAP